MRKTIFRSAAFSAALFLCGAIAAAQDTISVKCFEDYYQADANFSLTIDGTVVSSSTPCSARSTSEGVAPATLQTSSFSGSWGGSAKAHSIVVKFLNDAYGGSATTDRNLYVVSVSFDGAATTVGSFTGKAAILGTAGAKLLTTNDSATFTSAAVAVITPPAPPSGTSGSVGSIVLSCSGAGTIQYAVLTVTCNAAGKASSVVLTWIASTSSGITGYNLYRSTTSGAGFVKIGSTTGALSFTDTTVQSGTTYYYVATALAGSSESADSNQATAVIP